jgi:hypothetical protein
MAASACNVNAPHLTGGISSFDAAAPASDGSTARCDRGVFVIEQGPDYQSTNVAVLAMDGTVLQESIASSATDSVGLTAPLSGDVVPPTEPVPGDEIVLVDRAMGASRLVWVDLKTAARRVLPVDTGFSPNPQDYAQVSLNKGYVPRYAQNAQPGKQPFDGGSDLLVVDPSEMTITGSIDLRPALGKHAAAAQPDAVHVVVVGKRAFVLLEVLGADLSASAPSRLVTIDVTTDAITDVLALDGFQNCAGLMASPLSSSLGVLCSGGGDIQQSPGSLDGSGVVVVDITATPVVKSSYRAADLGENRIGFSGDYAGASAILFQTFGYSDLSGASVSKDTLVRLDLESGQADLVLDGAPFSLGGVACDVACGSCFVADSDRTGGVVHRLAVDAMGRVSDDRSIKAERAVGLAPRTLGKF